MVWREVLRSQSMMFITCERRAEAILQWATVILPAKPESIARSEAGVDIVAGGQSFMLPAGPAADLVLANKARWGLTQADGSFALSPMPR